MNSLGNKTPDTAPHQSNIEDTQFPDYKQVANVLVVKRSGGAWRVLFIFRKEGDFAGLLSIPGGEVDIEQDGQLSPYRSAASRELSEETTLDKAADHLRPVGIGVSHEYSFESHLFALELPPQTLFFVYTREPENHEVRWLTPDEARAYPLAPGVSEMLERIPFDRAQATLDLGAFATQQVIEFGNDK